MNYLENKKQKGEKMKEVIKFKSASDNYSLERSGKKANTCRQVDSKDERFKKLYNMQQSRKYGKIQINLAEDDEEGTFFVRQITSVVFWSDICIISWDSHECTCNGGGKF